MKLLCLLVFAGSITSCGAGRTPLDPAPTVPPGGGYGGNGGDFGNPGQTGGSAGVDNAASGSCHGTCLTPPGPVQIFLGFDDLAAAVVGVWQICSDGHSLFAGAPSDAIGVEFGPSTSDGNGAWLGIMYYLKRGPSGPVHDDGPDYQLSYQVADDMTVACWSAANDKSGGWFEVMYSPCPREIWLKDVYHDGHNGTLAGF